MKTCTKCKVEKIAALFSTSKEAKDGLHSWCKQCVNFARKINRAKYRPAQQEYARRNAESIRNTAASRRSAPAFKAKKALWDKTYRQKHDAAVKAKKAAYYANRQHLRRAEYQRNKSGYIARAYSRLYKLKTLTPPNADRNAINNYYAEAKRLTISTGVKHEVDHILPISHGGLHHQDNLQVLVWHENRAKGSKILDKRR